VEKGIHRVSVACGACGVCAVVTICSVSSLFVIFLDASASGSGGHAAESTVSEQENGVKLLQTKRLSGRCSKERRE
jgi:hypothetical protein